MPAADVGHVRLDDGDPVRTHPDPRLGWRLEVHPDAGCHAIADQPPALAHARRVARDGAPSRTGAPLRACNRPDGDR